jgi:hypothetical protein
MMNVEALHDQFTPAQIDEWVAFFRVKEQRDALKWQELINAVWHSDDPEKFDYLQNLDFNDPPD